ncbi:hypothetical protein RDWZM_006457 [Blomia tropicalis]|uniref:Uncharacterized protein n=1 Tax=Blomia tropicalis TaxID=40697 RepID=A0A9Q0RNK9_BLOTA|nr:hypothetical protein RDWZM_006457 [Blomia tropicalis]
MDRRLSTSLPNGGPLYDPSTASSSSGNLPVPTPTRHNPRLNISVLPSSGVTNVNPRASLFLPIPESPLDPSAPDQQFSSPMSTKSQPLPIPQQQQQQQAQQQHQQPQQQQQQQRRSIPEGIYINANRPKRSSSIMSFGPNSRRRILALLDEVRKKRELRDRRKSDLNVTYYLDDLMFHDEDGTGSSLNSYRRRKKLYQFLNHPSGAPWAIAYHIGVFIVVFICLILTICATIPQLSVQQRAIAAVYLLEKIVITWFSFEFLARLWCCSCKKQYRGFRGKCRYLCAPSRLIDLLVLILTTVVLVLNPSKTGHEIFVVSAFRGFHRFFQIAQVLTLNRPLKPWKVLASVIYDQREQLFIILYTEFIVLCALSYLAFLVERDKNDNFNSIADAMWWAIVTLSTVGYGDRVPVTWIGKIISTIFTILGVAIFALPAGIIGTGLALKIEEEERHQIRNRKKVAAAILIQRAWRCWKANITYEMVARFFRERGMAIYKQHDYRNCAQKFVALAQFTIAKNKFRELMRPIDMKTVIQSYRDGQTEVLLRSKLLQQSIEELSRRVELGENRVSSLAMRLETRQSTFESRIDSIRQQIEGCSRQLLASQALIELLQPKFPYLPTPTPTEHSSIHDTRTTPISTYHQHHLNHHQHGNHQTNGHRNDTTKNQHHHRRSSI